ncbi:ABC transporter permease [Consotaella aegiceratis]|uniref:ABC transporter permease n=1 Tax=Consotaella aegiceratis TaxID=3097961 RepID=UPI002F40E785
MSLAPQTEPTPETEDFHDADGLLVDLAPDVRSLSFSGLVWRRFRRNKVGMTGAALVFLLLFTAIFADFLSPYDPSARNRDAIYQPPQAPHFFSDDGFQLVPYTHPVSIELDPETFLLVPTVDTGTRCTPEFLGHGWRYEFLGLTMDRHLLTASPSCPWFLLGTDRDGRDMLSRLVVGSQLTLTMAAIVVTIAVLIGTTIGIISGYFGGQVDHWLQRVVEFILALPELPLYFALVVVIPRQADPIAVFFALAGILSVIKWAQLAREVRGKTMSVVRLDYITAAEALGVRTPRLIRRHILPNVLSHVIVATTLMIPTVILLESFLSFLGIGVRAPLVSWGLLLNAAQDLQNLGSYPWVLSPVGTILVAVLGFNMLGDALRDAIDPYNS